MEGRGRWGLPAEYLRFNFNTVRQIERDTYFGTSLDLLSGQPPSAPLHNFIPYPLHEELLV
jgi:hypothetical protein